MTYWILQANPARYRVAEALADASSIRTWTVARYRRAIVPGDRFALWVSGARGGVYALGSVTAGAYFIPGDDRYWVNPAEAERPAWRVGIRIEEVLPTPILRAELAEDPAFAGASIIRMPGGGNPFPVTEPQWQAIESRRPGATALPLASGMRNGFRRAAGRQPSHQALAWTREEDILALDLFVRAGVVNGGRFLPENDPRVIALSEELRALPTHPGVARDERFRNPSGVALKLMNFRAVERAVKRDLGIAGAETLPAGMPRFSALDRALFEEYFSQGSEAWPKTLRPSAQVPGP
jgi:predicted RNA-binding protein with PUA-like domain